MRVKAEDFRPPSLLSAEHWGIWAILGGLSSVFTVGVALPMAFGVFAALALALAAPDEERAEEPPLSTVVIAAQFVRLGRPPDPNRMPDRQVRIAASAPRQETLVSKRTVERREELEEESPPPPDAVDDPIRRLADRARAFAELAEARELEGDPGGVSWGTASEAREGDLYLGRFVSLMKSGWTLPVTMSMDEVRSLETLVVVEFDASLRLVRHRLVRGSGDALFDQSVLDQLQRLEAAGTSLAAPPNESVAAEYRNSGRQLRFRGRDAQ